MRKNRSGILAIALVLAPALLAGCTGGDDAGNAPQVIGLDPDAGKPKARNFTDDPNFKDLPTAHFHHYWGDLQEVTVFGSPEGAGWPVPISNTPNFAYSNFGSLYGAEFNLETDGDDVTRIDEPVMNGKADTVFVGTKEIRVKIDWRSDTIPIEKVMFQWKPANTNKYKPEAGGQTFFSGNTFIIPLDQVGQSDPAHQFAVSRWSFRIWAISQSQNDAGQISEGLPSVPTVVIPPEFSVNVHMVAVNGGESQLDPPHPNFWTAGDEIGLGSTGEVTVDEPVVMTPVARMRDPQMTDIPFPPGNIVPLGTEKVIVKLRYDTQFPPSPPEEFRLGLAYHGADTLQYDFVGVGTAADGWIVWELLTHDPDDPAAEVKVDPPYETNTQWRFELVPIVMDGSDPFAGTEGLEGSNAQRYTLGWAGTYEMEFSAVKLPGFVLV